MNITSIGSLAGLYQTQNTSNDKYKQDQDQDAAGSKVNGRGGGPGAFFKDIMQTLQSLGISFPSAQNASQTNKATSANSSVDAKLSGTPDVRKALHLFMHDLHHALKQNDSNVDASAALTNNSSSKHKGLQNFSTDLQSLIASLGSSSVKDATNTNSTNSKLQTDFSNLLKAMGGTSDSKQTPSLSDFLSKLAQQLSSAGESGSGAIVNTTA